MMEKNFLPDEFITIWNYELFKFSTGHGHFPHDEELKNLEKDFFERHNIPLYVEVEEKNFYGEEKNSDEEKIPTFYGGKIFYVEKIFIYKIKIRC